ncbi:MAG: guanylate kinase [Actinomycetota bacterium]|nr:guanylate kinase [Actinomycetota bacterium]
MSRLVDRAPELWLSRSWTTRPRRPGENDTAYTFVDRPTFLERVKTGGFLEWAELDSNHELYGTPLPDPPPGADVVLEIDVQGAAQVRQRHPDAVVLLVVAPSPEVQAERMRARGDDEEQIAQRLALGAHEESVGRALANEVIVNDDLERAVEEAAGILGRYRNRPTTER